MRFVALSCVLLLAAPAGAETFNVALGNKKLGKLSYTENGPKATLRSILDNTPLGVFNGGFTGTSTGGASNNTFVGDSKSSRKNRVVTVKIVKGKAVNTDIIPASERTDQSEITMVQSGVINPVRAIGQLITANDCPAKMRLYDGRRVIALSPTGKSQSGDTLICTMSYKVVAGPGHLSPLSISSAKMQLNYEVAAGQQTLQQIQISSGIFKLKLNKKN